jgi:hypothetical protein
MIYFYLPLYLLLDFIGIEGVREFDNQTALFSSWGLRNRLHFTRMETRKRKRVSNG